MSATPARFRWRAFTSVLIALAAPVQVITGAMLFVSPPGRIANGTNWTLLGLRKQEWIALHLWFSTLFFIPSVCHLVFNWRPLLGYFRWNTSVGSTG